MDDPQTAIAIRTLIAAGFTITNSRRLPTHIEIECARPDTFGARVPYTVAVCEGANPPSNDLHTIRRLAENAGRVLVLVAKLPGDGWLSWQDFLDSLGGAVPSWRALGPSYRDVLLSSAANKLPQGMEGEAWQIFEDAVADGFEFFLGNRVNRLGGRKRGRRVSDMVAQTPDNHVLVLDTKASQHPLDVTWDSLRPLREYTEAQVRRQSGQFSVRSAIIVANSFSQDTGSLGKLSGDFLAATNVPLVFVAASEIADLVQSLAHEPQLRSAIDWRQIFCRGGFLQHSVIAEQIDAARVGRYPRGSPVGT